MISLLHLAFWVEILVYWKVERDMVSIPGFHERENHRGSWVGEQAR